MYIAVDNPGAASLSTTDILHIKENQPNTIVMPSPNIW